MRVIRLNNHNLCISEASEILNKYKAEAIDLSQLKTIGKSFITKAEQQKKIIAPPYSMSKLLNILDTDEYHSGCVDAIMMSALMQIAVKNKQVSDWLANAEFPGNEEPASILSEMLKYYLSCGNGFLIKMRNAQGTWVGLERLLPSEVQILENYDEFGFFRPDYIQVKNNQKKLFKGIDIIHFKKSTHKSNAWGLACLPVVLNIEILSEVKTFDYNNFLNGLLIDYFVIVEGGTLRDGNAVDENGNEVITDAYSEIEKALSEAKGNAKSHSSILIESESKEVKIRLEPLRQQEREGAFLSLKKDLREGIFAYHRVPARVVSQLIPGQLGGDNRSDMVMFYHFVIKPLQRRIAMILTKEFNKELNANCKAEDFDFGDLTGIFQSEDEKLFNQARTNVQ